MLFLCCDMVKPCMWSAFFLIVLVVCMLVEDGVSEKSASVSYVLFWDVFKECCLFLDWFRLMSCAMVTGLVPLGDCCVFYVVVCVRVDGVSLDMVCDITF